MMESGACSQSIERGPNGGGSDVPTAIANWLEVDDHDRPFFRDPDFVSAFGRPGPALLRAAVDEMKRRATAKAQAAGMPIAWNANLPDHHDERTSS